MVNSDIIKYIREAIEAGTNSQEIKQKLREAGWNEEVINVAFSEINSEIKPPSIPQAPQSSVSAINANSSLAMPKSIKILNTCIKLKLRFLYLMFALTAVFTGWSFIYIQKINAGPRWEHVPQPYSFLYFFIAFLAILWLLIFLDKRSIFYLSKKVKRARPLIIISAVLTVPVASFFFIAEGLGGALGNELLRQLPFIFYFLPAAILALILSGGAGIIILTSLAIAVTPSFKNYLDNPVSHKDKESLGASGFWMSSIAEYMSYAIIIVLLLVAAVDVSGTSCLGVARSQVGCYVSKAKSSNDISLCENSLPDPGYCYRDVIWGSDYNFDFCANAIDDDVSTRCFSEFSPRLSSEYVKTFGGTKIGGDESLCQRMKSVAGKDECYRFFADEKKQSGLCNAITNSKTKEECRSQVDPSFCTAEQGGSVEECWYRKAHSLKDSTLCEKAGSFLGNRCFYDLARELQNQQLCSRVKAEFDNGSGYTPNNCYLNLAVDTKNPTLCENITAGDRYTTKVDCLEKIK